MKKIQLTFVLLFVVTSFYSQNNDLYKLTGSAKMLGSWEGEIKNPITFKSSSQDNFKIAIGQQGMMLTLEHKSKSIILDQIEKPEQEGFIKVYEFDFDNDNDSEIIVFSRDYTQAYCRVFKISNGLVEMIGEFSPQFEVIVSKNFINFPYGGQGLSNEYYFRNDSFFELVYHNPKNKK